MKRIVSLLCAGVFLCLWAGCAGNPSPSSGSVPEQTSSTGTESTASATQPPNESQTENGGSNVTQTSDSAVGRETTRTTAAVSTTSSTTEDAKQLPIGSVKFSTPALPGDKMDLLMKNPNRGFRLEISMDVSTGKNLSNIKSTIYLADRLDDYWKESPTVVQTYFYLHKYRTRDLDSTALNNIQEYLDFCRSQQVTALIIFAYSGDDTEEFKYDASVAQCKKHIQQLKSIIEKNRDVIHAIHAGFIGYWGEWGPSKTPEMEAMDGRKAVLTELLNSTPSSLFVQVRYVWAKNLISSSSAVYKRVGWMDMYLTGKDNGWSVMGTLDRNDPAYKQVDNESPYTVNDGEMDWGGGQSPFHYIDPRNIDPYLMADRLNRHCFTTMSCFHNYREGGMANSFEMQKWKSRPATKILCENNDLPYSAAWFLDSDGKALPQNMFNYIQHYLGYYVEASGAKAEVTSKAVDVTVNLKNYGFAAPLAMKNLDIVLLDANNKVLAAKKACELVDLQTNRTAAVKVSFDKPQNVSQVKVGISFKNYSGISARLANSIDYVNGVNILGTIG